MTPGSIIRRLIRSRTREIAHSTTRRDCKSPGRCTDDPSEVTCSDCAAEIELTTGQEDKTS